MMAALAGSWECDLEEALGRARRKGLLDSLARVYAEFPAVTCDNCARCCFESPGVFFVEYLDALHTLAALPTDRRRQLLRGAVRELFFSWIEPDRTCIFLGPSGCNIYRQRPLACRLFGLVAPAEREQAEVEARLAARQEAQRLRLLGIEVPEAVIRRSLVSCDRVRDLRGERVRADADATAVRVADLDAALLPRQVVAGEFCFQSVAERLGAVAFGPEVVEGMRVQLLRRAQRGESVEELLDLVWRQARFPGMVRVENGDGP
jgi:Fe-S-cluster containining protein